MTRERPIRNLALLMQGQFVSNMGNQIFDIAMLLWIKELTGSAAIMGLAMLLTGLPTALLAPFGGSIADRFGHLRVVILSDLVSALAVGCVVAVVLLQPDPALAIAALCLGNVVLGLSASCF
ncbi:MAG: MFS transporter, partial [Alphaproteobacteria bacterium]|nr:MFS transporter [Alphaproteobacteria bacterium]